MTYILNKTSGAVLATIADGTINQTTSLTFVGKNYAGYGEIVNENLLHLLENFANSTSPPAITGQLWYDTALKKLKVYDGTRFNGLPQTEVSTSIPKYLNIGDFWWNSSENKLYVKSTTTGFTLIGPSAGSLGSAIILATAIDRDQNTKYVLKHSINGNLVAVSSNDEFNPNSTDPLYSQFPIVKKGISLVNTDLITGNSSTNGYYFWGTASHALRLGDHAPSDYLLKSTYDAGIALGLVIPNDDGILVGVGGILRVHGNSSSNEGKLTAVNGTSISFNLCYPTINDTPKNILTLVGNKLLPGAVPVDIGSTSTRFSNVYSTNIGVSTITAINTSTMVGSWQATTQSATDDSDNLATTAFVRNIVPTGIITMWFGELNAVPAGWALCNGLNGTPNLIDRFVVGAGTSYAVNSVGGSPNSVVVSHSHTASSTVTDPGHAHTVNLPAYAGATNPTLDQIGGTFGNIYPTTNSVTGITVSTTVNTAGVSGVNANLPPYYALAYIMKL